MKQTVPKEALVKGGVYRLYHNGVFKEEAVFSHLGGTSSALPIFHPPGEPSFQDIFALLGYGENWVAIYERDATPAERGA